MLAMMDWKSDRGTSTPMLALSVPLSSLSLSSSEPGYSLLSSLSLLVLGNSRVRERWPLPTVSGRMVVTISLSREGERIDVLVRLKISKTS